ncbi:hypothetical protein K7N18_34900, partial [Burkholderia arboris]|uniref:hypothetical protein n=1 Tax=Burkholderia arboris TaxID=488730 RepID=UPI001CA3D215
RAPLTGAPPPRGPPPPAPPAPPPGGAPPPPTPPPPPRRPPPPPRGMQGRHETTASGTARAARAQRTEAADRELAAAQDKSGGAT